MDDREESSGRIAIVEDDPAYQELLAAQLKAAGYEVRVASDGASGLALIKQWQPDAVLLDWLLPVLDGGAVTRFVKADPVFARTFVIIASARGEGSSRAEGIEIGADDYLVKPVEPKELLARLRNGLVLRRLQAELEEKNRELARLAQTDVLTELPNRRAFNFRIERELRNAERHNDAVALALLDLDRFKRINDRFGHDVGDEVLKEVGRRLRDACRAGDQSARIGGEEFAAIFTRTPLEGAIQAAERLCELISNTSIATSAGELSVSASIGVATAGGQIGYDPHELFRAADDALYRAKGEGRNRVRLSTVRSRRPGTDTEELAVELEKAPKKLA